MAIGRDFVWILFLNDMRHGHFEDMSPVARAETREALEAFVRAETVEPYRDPSGLPATEDATDPSGFGYRCNSTTWYKTFRKGGPLEWCNTARGDESFRQVPRIIDRSDEIDAILPVTPA